MIVAKTTPAKSEADRRKLYTQRWQALKTERTSWFGHWQEISDNLLPRSGRFFTQDRNRGEKKHNNILDSSACRAHRVLAAGLMAGMTSPARPWFRLTTQDDSLQDNAAVELWLDKVTKKMLSIFAHSNTYRALHGMYGELAAFGTGASIVLDDFDDVMRHYPLTCGEYAIATNHRGVVDTLYREFDITVAQAVSDFGIENVSSQTKVAFETGVGLDKWITILHAIEPRAVRDLNSKLAKDMPFASCYMEYGTNEGKFLRESGYKRFPALCPRWEVTPGDIYGASPAMEALGDVKQLQHEQLRKGQGIDYQTLPPLQVPTMYKGKDVDTLPGGLTYIDATGPGSGIRTAFDVQLNLQNLLGDIQDVRQRINNSFYTDLFLMLAQDNRSDITAREVAERHEEKMLMLGPVLERLHDELLMPLVAMTFDKMMDAGVVPPPPQELQGSALRVEFVSVLAQAQKAVGLAGFDRLIQMVAAIAPVKPDVLDMIDTDELTDRYADMLGVDPQIIVPEDKVAQIRADRAQQQQAAATQAHANAAATTAKTASEVDPNGLKDVIGMFSGYTGQ